MELPGSCAEGQCRGREETPAAGLPSASRRPGAAEPRDPQLQHRPRPAGHLLSRKPSEPAGLIRCLKASWKSSGESRGRLLLCTHQAGGEERKQGAGEAPARAGYIPSETLLLRASSTSRHCWTVCSLIRDRDIQTRANTHRNAFPYRKMRILNLQPSIETVYCSFVVTCLLVRISWTLTACLASPVPTAILGSRLSSSDLA